MCERSSRREDSTTTDSDRRHGSETALRRDAPLTQPLSDEVACQNCGKPVRRDDILCPHCGMELVSG